MVVFKKLLILCATLLLMGSCQPINPTPAPTPEATILRGTDFSQLRTISTRQSL